MTNAEKFKEVFGIDIFRAQEDKNFWLAEYSESESLLVSGSEEILKKNSHIKEDKQ